MAKVITEDDRCAGMKCADLWCVIGASLGVMLVLSGCVMMRRVMRRKAPTAEDEPAFTDLTIVQQPVAEKAVEPLDFALEQEEVQPPEVQPAMPVDSESGQVLVRGMTASLTSTTMRWQSCDVFSLDSNDEMPLQARLSTDPYRPKEEQAPQGDKHIVEALKPRPSAEVPRTDEAATPRDEDSRLSAKDFGLRIDTSPERDSLLSIEVCLAAEEILPRDIDFSKVMVAKLRHEISEASVIQTVEVVPNEGHCSSLWSGACCMMQPAQGLASCGNPGVSPSS